MFNHPFYTVNPLLSPPGGYFFQALLRGGGGGKKEVGAGLFNLVKCINGSKVSRERTCGYRAPCCYAAGNNSSQRTRA